ncbi:hypothetical protein [Actinoplanes derwentensis]|uniref:Uncharacterized protein n=1 Tax=Actinoplanes derwentensis TaxID=113562 RepID=A0A1H1XPV8_9ACTN|nr:hypothetical protein [Actinoplanes derwentensis]GID90444.1 hypothetical protein Ade03nite_93680 [Actinoplanes derwentensis]SDT11278.1 hypothetical protein SAMN04489716_2544 [Actinoplanes derwentensis]
MTNAELFHRLIEETAQADDWRSGSVRPGCLPLFNYWGPVLYLTPPGDVVRNDDEDGPLRPADPAERDFGLARAAEYYPELAHLKLPAEIVDGHLALSAAEISSPRDELVRRS